MTDTHAETEVPAGEQPQAEEVHGCPVTYSHGQQVVHVPRERLIEVVESLQDDGFNMLIDVTSVDYLADPVRELPPSVTPRRFEVVVSLLSHSQRRRLRLRVQVPGDDPVVPTLYDLYPGAEAMEREVYDLMGIVFGDHPDLTRILLPEDWEGHPLRKDYSQGRVPVQFKFPAGKYSAEDRP